MLLDEHITDWTLDSELNLKPLEFINLKFRTRGIKYAKIQNTWN